MGVSVRTRKTCKEQWQPLIVLQEGPFEISAASLFQEQPCLLKGHCMVTMSSAFQHFALQHMMYPGRSQIRSQLGQAGLYLAHGHCEFIVLSEAPVEVMTGILPLDLGLRNNKNRP